ncbi:MAG: hypothetical protein ACKVI4_16615 [Actinomycetales bacterium]
MHEAVARVFFFKQTSLAYEAGRPDDEGRPRKFDVGDLWDVLRTLRPTREMILGAWSHSLEYSIGTSSHGVNVMNAICEELGFVVDKVFRKMEGKSAAEYAQGEADELMPFMQTVDAAVHVPGGIGADRDQLAELGDQLKADREVRTEFRHKAAGSRDQEGAPLDAIKKLDPGRDASKRFSGALFPSLRTVAAYYKPKKVMAWTVGETVKRENKIDGFGGSTGLNFKHKTSSSRMQGDFGGDGDGNAREYDFAWLVLSDKANKDGTGAGWRECANRLKSSKMCTLFDMHTAGIADACFMLASNENKRACPEMPARLPMTITQNEAFYDENNKPFGKTSGKIKPQPWTTSAGTVDAHTGDLVECRPDSSAYHSTKIKIHAEIDRLHNRGRLPALMPHTSTKVQIKPPIRWQNGSGIEVNSVCVYEHVCMVMENIIACSKIPGLKGLQERFMNGGSAPVGLLAGDLPDGVDESLVEKAERKLPYSIDVTQMAWTIELAQKFYTANRDIRLTNFNEGIATQGLGKAIDHTELPEFSLRYPGFPGVDGELALRLISVPVGTTVPPASKQVDIAKANPLHALDAELLRYQTSVAIGRAATARDIEEHRRSLIGTGYVWGVEGDVFSFKTWQDHLASSLIGRGNVDPTKDETDNTFVDKGFTSVLDSELMLHVRLAERRALHKCTPEVKYGISESNGSTYRFLEAQTAALRAGRPRNKRPAAAPPRQLSKKRGGTGLSSDIMDNEDFGGGQAPVVSRAGPSGSAGTSHSVRRTDTRDDHQGNDDE